MVRRQVWRELGGLDEAFFPLWFEDVDFCRRIRDRGFSLYYIPEAVANHTGGHSIPSLTVEMRRVYWYRSLLRYSSKHFHPLAFRVVCLAVLVGSFVRGFAEAAGHRSLAPIAAYGKVARVAGRCLYRDASGERRGRRRGRPRRGSVGAASHRIRACAARCCARDLAIASCLKASVDTS